MNETSAPSKKPGSGRKGRFLGIRSERQATVFVFEAMETCDLCGTRVPADEYYDNADHVNGLCLPDPEDD